MSLYYYWGQVIKDHKVQNISCRFCTFVCCPSSHCSFSTDDDNDTEVEAVDMDTELNLVTECWVEPQSGTVMNCMDQYRHFQGLKYQEVPQAVSINTSLNPSLWGWQCACKCTAACSLSECKATPNNDPLCYRSSRETWPACPPWWPLSIWASCVRTKTRCARYLSGSRMWEVTQTHKWNHNHYNSNLESTVNPMHTSHDSNSTKIVSCCPLKS